jgi:type II secretory pathway component PulK
MNTAPEHVLAALFEAAGNTDGDRAAERFIRTRRGGSGGSIDNDNAFKTIQDVQNSDIGGILGAMQALHPLDVRSTVFTVRATGRVGDSTTVLEAVVERSLATLQRDETFEAIDRAREREALYEDRRKRRQDRDNERVVRVPNIRILSWNQP